jgi:drug/metabolite transporter (DMT)-like permease
MSNIFWLSVFSMMLASGQVLFKRIALAVHGLPLSHLPLSLITQPLLYITLALYGAATLLWIWILGRVPLSQAYPWVAVGVLLVPVLGWWFYHERPAPLFWVGVSLVIAGLLMTQYGSQAHAGQ